MPLVPETRNMKVGGQDMAMLRRVLTVCSLALVASLLMPAGAFAETEPANNRFTGADGPMVNNVTVNASLSAVGDEDWYYFYVGATGDFTVSNTAYIVLYKYDGGALRELWYASGGGSTLRQLQPGLYYIRIYKDSPPKAYALKVTGPVSSSPPSIASTHRPATPMDEIYESSTTGYTQAQLVAPYAECLATIGASGDTDWYKFYVTQTSDVTVGQWAPKGASLCVYSDPTQSEIVWFNSLITESKTRQLEPGVYYVKVFGWSPPQEYTITIQGQYVSLTPPIPALTSITIKTNATTTSIGKTPILSGAITPNGIIGKIIVVYVKKPGKTYWTYSSNRVAYSLYGNAAWQYKYFFKKGMAKGTYTYKAAIPAYPGYLASVSPTTVSIRVK
jgi:hypothetical protein